MSLLDHANVGCRKDSKADHNQILIHRLFRDEFDIRKKGDITLEIDYKSPI